MRQLFYIAFFAVIALACFWGVFKYVSHNESLMDSLKQLKITAPHTEAAPEITEPIASPDSIGVTEANDSLQSDISQEMASQTSDVRQPPPFSPATQSELEERASEEWHTFTDQKGRELVAQVISTTDDSLQIRRYSDIRIFFIPINSLCEQDQEFVAYLHQRRENASIKMKSRNFYTPVKANDRFKNFNY